MKPLSIAALLLGSALVALPLAGTAPVADAAPESVTIPAGLYAFRPSGEFRQGRRIVDPPLETRMADGPLTIMKYLVSRAE